MVVVVWLFICGILIGRLMSGYDIRFVAVGMIALSAVGALALRPLVRRLPRTRTCNQKMYRAAMRLVHSNHCSLLMYHGEQIVALSITFIDNSARVECQKWRLQGVSNNHSFAVRYVIRSDGTVNKSRAGAATPHGHESTTITHDELDRLRKTLDTYPLEIANT